MDLTHLHLLITHLPIFGSVLGALVLIYGISAKSDSTKTAAYFLFVVAALGAGVAYLTGESAEETVEHIQGVSENMIEQHEESAVLTLVALLVLGVLSLAGVFAIRKKVALSKTLSFLILLVALIGFGLASRTGYLGGQIRHTEINTAPSSQSQGELGEGEE